jgi:hypothetical protein
MTATEEPIRVDHMTVQYVWALENDQVFMMKARHEVDRGNYDRFRILVKDTIAPTRRLLGEAHTEGINGYEWSFLTLELWCRMGGRFVDFPNSKDMGPFACHVDRLRAVGYGFNRNGVIRFVTNPCAEVSIGHPQLCTLNPKLIQENKMSNQITIKKITYINNADVTLMSDDQLIDAIKKVEKEIEDLKAVKTQSKKIAARIEEATATLTQLVELLDNR